MAGGRLALSVFWAAAPRAAPAGCLPYGLGEAQRRNVTAGVQNVPLGIWQLDWVSSRVTSNIMRIIAEEVLGYHVVFGIGRSSNSAVHALGGCPDGTDCLADDLGDYLEERWHLSFELWQSWVSSTIDDWQANRSGHAPVVLDKDMGYAGTEVDCISPQTLRSGLSLGVDLREYHAYKYSPSSHFDGVGSVGLERLLPCSEWTNVLGIAKDLDIFAAKFPSELDHGVQADGGGGHAPLCDADGKWWMAPSCRENRSLCVPYIATELGWGVAEMLQRATALDMPVAIAIVNSIADWAHLVRHQQVMNYWWFPDHTFSGEGLSEIRYKAHNKTEWDQDYMVSARNGDTLLKLAAQGLDLEGDLVSVASNLELSAEDIRQLIDEVSLGASAEQVACWWLGNNSYEWHRWVDRGIIEPLSCPPGYGVADLQAQALLPTTESLALEAKRCTPCPPGRRSQPHEEVGPYLVCYPCPPGTFNYYQVDTGCTSCPRGTSAGAEGSTACDVCPFGRFAAEEGSAACSPCAAGASTELRGALAASSCQQCEPGKFSTELEPCQACTAGRFSSERGSTACEECQRDSMTDGGGVEEQCRELILEVAAVCLLVTVLLSTAAVMVGLTSRRRFQIADVREWGGRTILTTVTPHRLVRYRKPLRCFLEGSPHPSLQGEFWVRWHSRRTLQLEDSSGSPLGSVDSSSGTLALGFPWGLVYTGWLECRFVTVSYFVLVIFVASVALIAAVQVPAGYVAAIFCASGACGAVTMAIAAWCYRYQAFSPLHEAVLDFKDMSAALLTSQDSRGPARPTEAPMGPHRAVSAGQISDFMEFFRQFIRTRNMYYVVGEIVKPITEEKQCSFADVVGAGEVQWFVSHSWGDCFNEFVRSLRHHAQEVAPSPNDGEPVKLSKGAAGVEWRSIRYWVCSFSINQWRAEQEVGRTPLESSFYLALRHSTCVGTVMVIQDTATPLTRSWCLFEVLQTFLLKNERGEEGFRGLFLVTHSGVLNSGAAPVDTVMKIAVKIVTVFFEDAKATRDSDKEMIEKAVNKDSRFIDLNKFLREHMRQAVLNGKQRLDGTIELILDRLKVVERPDESEEVERGLMKAITMPFSTGQSSASGSSLGGDATRSLGFDEADPHEAALLPNVPEELKGKNPAPPPGLLDGEPAELLLDGDMADAAASAPARRSSRGS